MGYFHIDKTLTGRIDHKSEWDNLNPQHSPLESLAIVEFLRQQYIFFHKLPTRIDKTTVGFRSPKKRK